RRWPRWAACAHSTRAGPTASRGWPPSGGRWPPAPPRTPRTARPARGWSQWAASPSPPTAVRRRNGEAFRPPRCTSPRSRSRAAAPHDAAAVHGVLREAFPTCFVFAAGRGDASFLAASPELLLRREGLRLSTMALAGSTRRSADPAVDDHLGERLRTSAKDRSE